MEYVGRTCSNYKDDSDALSVHSTYCLALYGIFAVIGFGLSVYVICYMILYTKSYAHYPQSYPHGKTPRNRTHCCEYWKNVGDRRKGDSGVRKIMLEVYIKTDIPVRHNRSKRIFPRMTACHK